MTRQGEELVLLDTRSERYYTLNEVGAVAWRILMEPATCAAIVEAIRHEFDVSDERDSMAITSDVVRLIDQLVAANLVAVASKPSEVTP